MIHDAYGHTFEPRPTPTHVTMGEFQDLATDYDRLLRQVTDYRERLAKAAATLSNMAQDPSPLGDDIRLASKAEGVRLALSYLDETFPR